MEIDVKRSFKSRAEIAQIRADQESGRSVFDGPGPEKAPQMLKTKKEPSEIEGLRGRPVRGPPETPGDLRETLGSHAGCCRGTTKKRNLKTNTNAGETVTESYSCRTTNDA